MNGEREKTEILSVKHLFVEGTISQGNKRLFEISDLTSGDIHKQSISYPLRPCQLDTTELFAAQQLVENLWENPFCIYLLDQKQKLNLSFLIMRFFLRAHK